MKIELAHDILAKKVYEMASTEDKMLIKVHQFIKNRLAYYLDSGVILDRNGLNYIDPYMSKITLDEQELSFIRKSYRINRRNRMAIQAIAILTCAVLLVFGIQATKTFYGLQLSINKKKSIRKKLNKTKENRQLAELKAQQLLEQSSALSQEELNDLDNIDVIKQIIIQYDTLGKQQANALKDRDLAQSATLSDLAESAKTQKDDKYAFQLAVKAWELNKDNNQALEVIQELSKPEDVPLAELPQEEQASVIKKEQRRNGKLKDKDLAIIFDKENTVGESRNIGIKKIVQTTKGTVRQEKKIKMPAIYQVMQQTDNQSQNPIEQKIERIIPNPKSSSCALAKKNVNQWITVKRTPNFNILVSFGSDKKIYFKLKHHNPVTTNNSIQLKLCIGSTTTSPLIRKKGANNKYFYVADLSSSDKKLLQRKNITGLQFTSSSKSQIGQSDSGKKIVFTPDVQLKLLTMSKCLL